MEIEAVNGDSNKEEDRGRRLYKEMGEGGEKGASRKTDSTIRFRVQ